MPAIPETKALEVKKLVSASKLFFLFSGSK